MGGPRDSLSLRFLPFPSTPIFSSQLSPVTMARFVAHPEPATLWPWWSPQVRVPTNTAGLCDFPKLRGFSCAAPHPCCSHLTFCELFPPLLSLQSAWSPLTFLVVSAWDSSGTRTVFLYPPLPVPRTLCGSESHRDFGDGKFLTCIWTPVSHGRASQIMAASW